MHNFDVQTRVINLYGDKVKVCVRVCVCVCVCFCVCVVLSTLCVMAVYFHVANHSHSAFQCDTKCRMATRGLVVLLHGLGHCIHTCLCIAFITHTHTHTDTHTMAYECVNVQSDSVHMHNVHYAP